MKEITKYTISDSDLVLVDVNSLSLTDEFMRHIPVNENEAKLKEFISEAIQKDVKNFYKLRGNVSYIMPASITGYDCCKKAANELMPERKSRLGSKLEHSAFRGVLIKKLVEEGKSMEWAWKVVCDKYWELLSYWKYQSNKFIFESTDSLGICGLCDFIGEYKVLALDNETENLWFVFNNVEYLHVPFGKKISSTDQSFINTLCTVGWPVFL